MGYRRAETTDVIPVSQNKTPLNEPHPIDIFGEEKPISDKKLSKYLTDDVFHYIEIYENNNKFGFPYKDWTEMPPWLTGLHKTFDRLKTEYEYWQTSKQYKD